MFSDALDNIYDSLLVELKPNALELGMYTLLSNKCEWNLAY